MLLEKNKPVQQRGWQQNKYKKFVVLYVVLYYMYYMLYSVYITQVMTKSIKRSTPPSQLKYCQILQVPRTQLNKRSETYSTKKGPLWQ